MNVRLCVLGAWIAALPVAIDLPASPDSAAARRGETRLEAMAGRGQFSVITRGCEGQILSEIQEQVDGGGLALEHRFPQDWVVGVRGGTLRTSVRGVSGSAPAVSGGELTTRYVNPYAAYEGGFAGVGAGWLDANQPFPLPGESWFEPRWSGHVRLGGPEINVSARFMEDVPLQAGSYLSLEAGVRPHENVELGFGPGLLGPFDGAMLGVRGRWWITREAALQARAGLGSHGQYWVAAGARLRAPDPLRRR